MEQKKQAITDDQMFQELLKWLNQNQPIAFQEMDDFYQQLWNNIFQTEEN